jgi:hypothetical protein
MFKKVSVFMSALLLAVLFSSISEGAKQYQWKAEGVNDGSMVYTSVVPGKEYIAAKAVRVIPARMEVVGMVIRDIEGYKEWMKDCTNTKVLKVVNEQNDTFILWFHQHVALLTDRDMVLKSNVTLNYKQGKSEILAESTKEMNYDSGKKLVRMPSFMSHFLLEWVDRDHTRVTFTIDPDLDKGVPIGIANSTIKGIPGKSLEGLAKMCREKKYIDSAKTSKYNKMIEDSIKQGFLKDKK